MSIQPRENFDVKSRINSRYLLGALAALIAVAAWACGGDPETIVVKETVVVEVEKQVQVTVEVEKGSRG